MGRKYAIRDQQAIHFVTITVINWIDLFIRDVYKEIIIDSLKYCQQNKGLRVHAYCIMTSHIHLILSVGAGKSLSDTLRDFKSFTSTKLKHAINDSTSESRKEWLIWMFERAGKKNKRNSSFQLWQQNNHPIELSSNALMDQRLAYVHNNPVEAGFVDDPSSWVWSSCASYEKGIQGKIDLLYIE